MKTFKEFVSESFGRDTWKAMKTHYKLERKRKNPLIRPSVLIPTSIAVGASVGMAMANKDYASAATTLGAWSMAISDHVSDIKKIRQRIKDVRNGQEKHADWKKKNTEYLDSLKKADII